MGIYQQNVKKKIAIGNEGTFKTKASSNWGYLEWNEENMSCDRPKLPDNEAGARGSVSNVRRLPGRYIVGGSLSGNAFYPEGGIPMLILAAMGAVSSSQQGGTAAYSHAFTLIDDIVYGWTQGITVRVDRDKAVLDYVGCVVSAMTVNLADNAVARVTFDMFGVSEEGGSTPSPSFPSAAPMRSAQAQILIDGNAAYPGSLDMTLNNLYDNNQYGMTEYVRYFPRSGERRLVTGNINFTAIDDFSFYTKFKNHTEASLRITLTGALIEGAYNYSIDLNFPSIYYEGPTDPGAGGEVLVGQTVPFTAYKQTDGTMEMTCTIVSTETSI